MSIEVEVPSQPLWLWRLLAPFFLLVPAAIQESHETYVRISTRSGVRHLNLGRPSSAPYSRRCRRATIELFDDLGPENVREALVAGRGLELVVQAQCGE